MLNKRLWWAWFLGVALLCGAAHVQAQDNQPQQDQTYERFRLPEGTRLTVDGVTYQGFNLGEYVQLLHMDEDLRYLTQVVGEDTNKINELTVAIAQLQAAQTSQLDEVNVLKTERQRLLTMWTQENQARHRAEESHNLDWLPWSIAIGLAVVCVVLIVAIAAN